VVLLREKRDNHDGRLVTLKAANSTQTHRGVIQHADVIGKEPRQIVQSSKGATYRVIEPTLAEYVRLTPRLVTPVRICSCPSLMPVEIAVLPSQYSSSLDLPVRHKPHSLPARHSR